MARTLNFMSFHCFVIALEKVYISKGRGIFGRKKCPFVMIYDITKMAKEKKNFFLSFLVTLHQVVVISSNSSDSCYDINNNSKS